MILLKTPNDYLREWLPKRREYLGVLMEFEAPPSPQVCGQCQGENGDWKCLECIGRPVVCEQCCKSIHLHLPFHRIQKWTGTHFMDAWLEEVGVVLNLGHRGRHCPGEDQEAAHQETRKRKASNDVADDGFSGGDQSEGESDGSDNGDDEDLLSGPSLFTISAKKNTTMTVVDRSGVHQLPVTWCHCPNAPSPDIQLLEMGLFPASFRRIKTCFTFQVLEDFRIDHLECKTSAMSFYSKIRRVTSRAFPHRVPVSR